jgi:hypothetical protein
MIRSVREPSSLTSQRPPPQTPLATNSRPHRGTGLDPGPAPGTPPAPVQNNHSATERAAEAETAVRSIRRVRVRLSRAFRVVGCKEDQVTVPLARPPGPYISACRTNPGLCLSTTRSSVPWAGVPDIRVEKVLVPFRRQADLYIAALIANVLILPLLACLETQVLGIQERYRPCQRACLRRARYVPGCLARCPWGGCAERSNGTVLHHDEGEGEGDGRPRRVHRTEPVTVAAGGLCAQVRRCQATSIITGGWAAGRAVGTVVAMVGGYRSRVRVPTAALSAGR